MIRELVLCVALLSGAAHAGRTCEQQPLLERKAIQAMDLAVKTRAALDASGARAVVIARMGQDLRAYAQRFSHLGLAYKNANGQWLVLHKLNDCGTAESGVYEQGLAEFFLDDMFVFETGFAAFNEAAERQVLAWINSNAKLSMHERAYNMLAYPWSTRYQQSNQWALESLMQALHPELVSRAQAQAKLEEQTYSPAVLKLSTSTRLGARLFRANVAFDDHPNEKRFTNRIETVSADSVFAHLQRKAYVSGLKTVR